MSSIFHVTNFYKFSSFIFNFNRFTKNRKLLLKISKTLLPYEIIFFSVLWFLHGHILLHNGVYDGGSLSVITTTNHC